MSCYKFLIILCRTGGNDTPAATKEVYVFSASVFVGCSKTTIYKYTKYRSNNAVT